MSALDSVAQCATAVGVFVLAGQVQSARAGQRATFEQSLADRYVQIIKDIPTDEFMGRKATMDRAYERHYFEYFTLCEEEIYYRAHRKVSRSTWRDWWIGIQINMARAPFADAWKALHEETHQFEGFARAVRYLNDTSPGDHDLLYDPAREVPRWRAMTGWTGWG